MYLILRRWVHNLNATWGTPHRLRENEEYLHLILKLPLVSLKERHKGVEFLVEKVIIENPLSFKVNHY